MEVHTNPDKSFSDGPQSLWPQQFDKLLRDIEALCPTVDREMARLPERHQKEVIRTRSEGTTQGDLPKVAFQGERGANSEKAIHNYYSAGDVEPLPLPAFKDIFKAVLSGDASWGMVPVENSLAGSVLENYDLLSRYPDVKIVGEIKVRVRHNLIVRPGTRESEIRRVYSHPQALLQCAEYIAKKGWEQMPFFDTAGAAAMVARSEEKGIAAIASAEAAEYHRMEILAEDIETNPRNYTRFAVIAHIDTPEPENIDKASFTFTIKSHPGALADCLAVLKKYDIDMTRLESRPIAGKPWSYKFYVDVMMPEDSAAFKKAETDLKHTAEEYRNLGVYRSS